MKRKIVPTDAICCAAIAAIVLVTVAPASADTLVLTPTADSYIRASQGNQGANTLILIGDTAVSSDYLRGAFAFDLSDPVLTGATINSVTLTLTIGDKKDDTSGSQAVTLDLHELSASFVEGNGNGSAPPTEVGVTWTSRDGTNNWTTPGGDFGAALVSLAANAGTVNANTSFDFTSGALTTAGAGAVGGSLYLIAKLAEEGSVSRSVFRFGSRTRVGDVPTLTIEYSVGGGDFASWIGDPAFGLDPADRDFADDPDGDGLDNGLEGFFGTDPSVSSAGLTGISKSGNTVSFLHPNPDTVLSDVTGGYEWSLDLVTWYADDGVDGDGSTTLTTVATANSPTDNVTTVEATIGGAVPTKIFLRVVAEQTF